MVAVTHYVSHPASLLGLAKRAAELVKTTGTATITQTIHTPWMIILGLWAISLLVSYISARRTETEQVRYTKLRQGSVRPDPPAEYQYYAAGADEPVLILHNKPMGHRPMGRLTGAVWIFNFVRSAAAALYLLVDLAGGHIHLPSVGVSITFASLLANALHIYDGRVLRLASYVSFGVSVIGIFLYLIAGAIALSHGSDANKSLLIQLQQGCAGETFNNRPNASVICTRLAPNQTFHLQTSADKAIEIGWYVGVFVLVLVLLAGAAGLFRTEQLRMRQQTTIRGIIFFMALAAGVPATVGSVLNALSNNANYIDCAAAVAVPSNGSWVGCANVTTYLFDNNLGFWDVWSADKTAAVRAAFLWD